MIASGLARNGPKSRLFRERFAKYSAWMATDYGIRLFNGAGPGNPGHSHVEGQDLEVQTPAAGPNDQGAVGNASGGRDQEVGPQESSSEEESPSKEESSTPPSSRPSASSSPPQEQKVHPLELHFNGITNVTVGDSRQLEDVSLEEDDPVPNAELMADLEWDLCEEGED